MADGKGMMLNGREALKNEIRDTKNEIRGCIMLDFSVLR
jgi:hypothetical protein